MTRVTVRPRLRELGRDIRTAVEEGARSAAEQLPDDITDELDAGRKPDGSPQPALAESTIRGKRAKGQPLTPGVAERVMADPSRWRVDFQTTSQTVVRPPSERAGAMNLQNRSDPFEFVGVPRRFLEQTLPDAIRRALDQVKGGE